MEVTEGSTLAETIEKEIAAEAQPEKPAEATPAGHSPAEGAPRPQQTVPFRVFQEARRHNQELVARLEALEKATAPKPEAAPDPKLDPVGYLAWLNEHQSTEARERETRAEEEARTTRERQEQEQVIDAYYEAVDEFRDANADFDDAYNYIVKWGHDQLKAQGVRNPRQRAMLQAQYEYQFVKAAHDAGLNPALAVFAKAQELGWQKAAVSLPNGGIVEEPGETAAGQLAAGPGLRPGTNQPPRNPTTGQFTPAKPPRSLSQAAGSASNPMSAEALAKMPAAEFDKLVKDDGWRHLHGR